MLHNFLMVTALIAGSSIPGLVKAGNKPTAGETSPPEAGDKAKTEGETSAIDRTESIPVTETKTTADEKPRVVTQSSGDGDASRKVTMGVETNAAKASTSGGKQEEELCDEEEDIRISPSETETIEKEIPMKWEEVGKVEKIILYPLKSAKGREIDRALCTVLGPREIADSTPERPKKYLFQDRVFVVYDPRKGKALIMSQHPKVVLISVDSVDEDKVIFRAPNVPDLTVKVSEVVRNQRIETDNYGIKFDAVDCGDEAAKWMSDFLGNEESQTLRLGYYAEKVVPPPDPIGTMLKVKGFAEQYQHWRKDDGGLYSHLTSYHLVTTSSIVDANTRLADEDKFDYRNLRPNILVSGPEKYAEDQWKWMKIGDKVILRTVKPCTRCMTVTVRPDDGTRNERTQPLKTLRAYRSVKHIFPGQELQAHLAVFGINAGLYEPGEIRLNDPVYVSV